MFYSRVIRSVSEVGGAVAKQTRGNRGGRRDRAGLRELSLFLGLCGEDAAGGEKDGCHGALLRKRRFGSEALLFLSFEQPADLPTWQLGATAFVRTTLLAGCALLSLLALRATWNRAGREGRHDNVRRGS
jgi:hypothetical protein